MCEIHTSVMCLWCTRLSMNFTWSRTSAAIAYLKQANGHIKSRWLEHYMHCTCPKPRAMLPSWACNSCASPLLWLLLAVAPSPMICTGTKSCADASINLTTNHARGARNGREHTHVLLDLHIDERMKLPCVISPFFLRIWCHLVPGPKETTSCP